jgi:hypothetical protein
VTIEQPDARPWITCQSGAEYETVADLSERSRCVSPRGERRIALTPEWTSQTFPPRFTVRVPRVPRAGVGARGQQRRGVRRLAPLRLRREGTYLFHAQAGAEVVLAGSRHRSAAMRPTPSR